MQFSNGTIRSTSNTDLLNRKSLIMPYKTLTAFLGLFVLTISINSASVTAHGGAKGIVKERMELMKDIGKAMKSLGAMGRGKAPLDSAKIKAAAGSIARHGQKIPALFPKGSSKGVTEASPRIWKDPEGFQKSTNEMVAAARNIAGQSENAAELKAAYRRLGKTCSACHKLYRVKKKKM
jgi:cytochrome c556